MAVFDFHLNCNAKEKIILITKKKVINMVTRLSKVMFLVIAVMELVIHSYDAVIMPPCLIMVEATSPSPDNHESVSNTSRISSF